MDSNLLRAVIKTNISGQKQEETYNSKDSVISFSSIDEEDGDKSLSSLRLTSDNITGGSVKEIDEQVAALKKENFNLKLRIYFLEERMGVCLNFDCENIIKNNVDLMVELEGLKRELQGKYDLLCQAVRVMDLEEEKFKETTKAKDDEILALTKEKEILKLQFQNGEFEIDTESSHKNYYNESLFLSLPTSPRSEMDEKMRTLEEKVESLENELTIERKHSESCKEIIDRTETVRKKCELLQLECKQKEDIIANLSKELAISQNKISEIKQQMKTLEEEAKKSANESEKLTQLLEEKSDKITKIGMHMSEIKRECLSAMTELEKEKNRCDKNKFMNEMKQSELGGDLDKQKKRVQDLQKKLGSANQDLNENQKILVPKTSNAATSPGIQEKDALCDALRSFQQRAMLPEPSALSASDVHLIYQIMSTFLFQNKY